MGIVRPPPQDKLIVGLLAGDDDLLREACRRLTREFGEIDLRSESWSFEATEYYRDELGDDILRQFVSFKALVSPDRLAEIKRTTNDLEQRFCHDLAVPSSARTVNVDPGLISLAKLVMATTKDHAHRIYLGQGIHAEVTLRYVDRKWTPWPWTYPDYAARTYHTFFDQVREVLKGQYRDAGDSPSEPRR